MSGLPRGHLSPSQISAWNLCQIRFRTFNVEQAKAPPDFVLATKIKTHEVILEKDLGYKIKTGANLSDSEMSETYRAELEQLATTAKEDPNLEATPEKAIQDEVTYFDTIIKETGRWRKAVIPLEVEQTLEGQIGGIPVVSRYDLKASEIVSDRIWDLKRQGQAPQVGSASKSLQLSTYAILTGIADVGLAAIVENKTPKVALEPGQITDAQLKRAELTYQGTAFEIENALKADVWIPVDHGDARKAWVCTARFCGAWRSDSKDWVTGTDISCEFGQKSQAKSTS